ncbi:MAG: hypothetical protein SPL64_00245 [Bacteroidaceae bacterium]|nr:hypothetical protein [Bacteroidaceae bacterium]
MRQLREKPTILDPRVAECQVFLTDAFQLGYVLEQILAFTGKAKITASTFGNGEEFLRKLIMLKNKGMITESVLYCDTKAAEKNAKMHPLLRSAYDRINFCDNHSKVLVIEGAFPVVLLASQNQTRGNRLENYVIIQNEDTAEYCLKILAQRKTAQLHGFNH